MNKENENDCDKGFVDKSLALWLPEPRDEDHTDMRLRLTALLRIMQAALSSESLQIQAACVLVKLIAEFGDKIDGALMDYSKTANERYMYLNPFDFTEIKSWRFVTDVRRSDGNCSRWSAQFFSSEKRPYSQILLEAKSTRAKSEKDIEGSVCKDLLFTFDDIPLQHFMCCKECEDEIVYLSPKSAEGQAAVAEACDACHDSGCSACDYV